MGLIVVEAVVEAVVDGTADGVDDSEGCLGQRRIAESEERRKLARDLVGKQRERMFVEHEEGRYGRGG